MTKKAATVPIAATRPAAAANAPHPGQVHPDQDQMSPLVSTPRGSYRMRANRQSFPPFYSDLALAFLHAQGVGGQQGFHHQRIVAGRDLEVAGRAREDLDELTQLLDQLCFILADDPLAHRLLVRLQDPVVAKNLRRLNLHQVGTLNGPVDEAGAVDMLVGVVDGDGRGCRAMLPGSFEARVDQVIADKGSRAIMNDDEIRGILLQAQQAKSNRVLPSLAA